jgi:large subunit ribosomal protein L29
MKNTQELAALNVQELNARIAEATRTLRNLKFAHAVTPLENPMSIRNTRRQIARMRTILTAKQKS